MGGNMLSINHLTHHGRPRAMASILFYNSVFDEPPSFQSIPPELRSIFSVDKNLLNDVDAVVFHVPDLGFGKPDANDIIVLKKKPGQLWVAWSMESSVNYPFIDHPSFRAKMDIFMTYRRDAEVWLPYLPDKTQWDNVMMTQVPQKVASSTLVMFQSDPINRSKRLEFAKGMMEHIRIDSFGKVLRNAELPFPDEGHSTKLRVVGDYKFCLSLENAIETDYVTEKFFDPLRAGTVPVYRGAPNVDLFAPGDECFIDASMFGSERELADYLKYLDHDDAAYARFFAWRQKPLRASFQELLDKVNTNIFERLVRLVEKRRLS
jgi:hypothetical protein